MSVRPMSRHLQAKYMRCFIDETLRVGKRTFDAKPFFPGKPSDRKMFIHHLRILEGLGLISVYWINGEREATEITVTKSGMTFLEKRAAGISDRRWSRWLSIVAILISLAALALEFDNRGYLDWAKPEKTHAAQSPSMKSESQ